MSPLAFANSLQLPVPRRTLSWDDVLDAAVVAYWRGRKTLVSQRETARPVRENGEAGSCVNSPRPLTEPPELPGGRLS